MSMSRWKSHGLHPSRRMSTLPLNTILSHMVRTEAHGHVHIPPVEETVTAYLSPFSATLGEDLSKNRLLSCSPHWQGCTRWRCCRFFKPSPYSHWTAVTLWKTWRPPSVRSLLIHRLLPPVSLGKSMEIVIKCFSEAQEAHKGDESPNAPAHISFTCICIVFLLFLQVENARFCNVSVCPIKTQTPSKELFRTHSIDMGLLAPASEQRRVTVCAGYGLPVLSFTIRFLSSAFSLARQGTGLWTSLPMIETGEIQHVC